MKTIEIMKRSTFLRHGSRMILKFDLSELKLEYEVDKVIDYFFSIVMKMPRNSILGLVDFRNMNITSKTLNKMIELTGICNPHFTASAFMASDEATNNLSNSIVAHYGKINVKVFGNQFEAINWLSSQ